jgi:hypothetical protein
LPAAFSTVVAGTESTIPSSKCAEYTCSLHSSTSSKDGRKRKIQHASKQDMVLNLVAERLQSWSAYHNYDAHVVEELGHLPPVMVTFFQMIFLSQVRKCEQKGKNSD